MAPPIGNKYWLRRQTHGRPLDFKDPEDLWTAAVEYFEWAHDTPLVEQVWMSSKDGLKEVEVRRMRAMTIKALCLYLDINADTWFEYCKRDAFKDVCERVGAVIFTQKFEGAAADLLNQSIIARELGLADKSEHSGAVSVQFATFYEQPPKRDA